ncbi:hypothetical protein [Actinopolymorpha pittospori]|uniref:Uncharacterized protein n=1 Tax=Actinopolymorpha pittospori TaxID=648752 RepID=A0A927N4D8_9ACTN|nr:hypothetical protein [Actinopolymorpha pittospori]MBE1612131.1 hypothetical protein [Actinopolymorpha pittospori]
MEQAEQRSAASLADAEQQISRLRTDAAAQVAAARVETEEAQQRMAAALAEKRRGPP